MKLAFFNSSIYAYAAGHPAAVGGAERQQWLLARALVAKGWEITVGVREGLRPGERQLIQGVDFLGVEAGPYLSAWLHFLQSVQPQWVYWRGANHWLGPLTAIARMTKAGTRTIFATAFDRDVVPHLALFRRQRWWPLYAWGLAWSHRIFVQHGEQFVHLSPRWQAKATILRSIASQRRAKSHIVRNSHVVWVAMLRQPKRPDLLLEIARQAPHLHFVVCGGSTTHRCPPDYSTKILKELSTLPNIEFLGQVAPDKTQHLIADASALLSTSDEEGFPNTYLEAWSSGTPVVTLTIDPDQIIKRYGLGRVSGTVATAIEDLTSLIRCPHHRDEIATHAQQYIREQHSEDAITRIFEQALTQ